MRSNFEVVNWYGSYSTLKKVSRFKGHCTDLNQSLHTSKQENQLWTTGISASRVPAQNWNYVQFTHHKHEAIHNMEKLGEETQKANTIYRIPLYFHLSCIPEFKVHISFQKYNTNNGNCFSRQGESFSLTV
jgi:hypothetical protein